MQHPYAVSDAWEGSFDEARVAVWARELRSRLAAPKVSLGLVFMSPAWFEEAAQALEVLRLHAQIPLLVGCSSTNLIANEREQEDTEGMVLGLYHLPGAELAAARFDQQLVEQAADAPSWHRATGITPGAARGWLVFADPFHLDAEQWLQRWNTAYPEVPVFGGLASGDFVAHRTQVYLNGDVFEEGGVALAVGGKIRLAGVISQGCTPIGESWTITRAERNLVREIGNRPAYEVLAETYSNLPPAEQRKTQGNLLVGLVVNEYLDDFHRGDFLIRNLLGVDPKSGAIAIGAWPRTGQILQFQRRDAEAAAEDLTALLGRAREQLRDATVLGGCLCCCNGRGRQMFGRDNPDASLVQHYLPAPGLTGFSCSGEIGPVGSRNFLHGFTASLALFVADPATA